LRRFDFFGCVCDFVAVGLVGVVEVVVPDEPSPDLPPELATTNAITAIATTPRAAHPALPNLPTRASVETPPGGRRMLGGQ
jgi:hypothetical protein